MFDFVFRNYRRKGKNQLIVLKKQLKRIQGDINFYNECLNECKESLDFAGGRDSWWCICKLRIREDDIKRRIKEYK